MIGERLAMGLREKQREWIEDFSIIEDTTERFSALVDRGRHSAPLPDEARTDAHLVPGCTSRVWITGWLDDAGRCQFRTEADAPSVHAVATLLCDLYSGATPAEVVEVEPDCLTELKIDKMLSPTRLRGIGQIRRRLRELAEGWSAT
ncbi:MAG: SufE family protein [Verrucomicrobiae bacterium]|nr:SufE family protein [Verrucomicrobiae bacterium]